MKGNIITTLIKLSSCTICLSRYRCATSVTYKVDIRIIEPHCNGIITVITSAAITYPGNVLLVLNNTVWIPKRNLNSRSDEERSCLDRVAIVVFVLGIITNLNITQTRSLSQIDCCTILNHKGIQHKSGWVVCSIIGVELHSTKVRSQHILVGSVQLGKVEVLFVILGLVCGTDRNLGAVSTHGFNLHISVISNTSLAFQCTTYKMRDRPLNTILMEKLE